jgi:hypothetical protein
MAIVRELNPTRYYDDTEIRMLLAAMATDFAARVNSSQPITRTAARKRLERMVDLSGALHDTGVP